MPPGCASAYPARLVSATSRAVPAAVLLTGGPLLFVAGRAIYRTAAESLPGWAFIALLGATLAGMAAGLLVRGRPVAGRVLATASVLAFLGAVAPALVERPAMALVVGVVAIVAIAAVWGPEPLPGSPAREALFAARAAAAVALAGWVIAAASQLAPWSGAHLAAAIAQLVAIAHLAWWLRVGPIEMPPWLYIVLAAVPVAALGLASQEKPAQAVSLLALVQVGTLLAARDREATGAGWTGLILHHPARLVVVTFLALCSAGTVLIALPICSATGDSIGLLDSAFTAVSAVCVTGLIVVDTAEAFSVVGQVVVLALIQLGALGIMSLSTAALGLLGRRLSLRHEGAVAGLFSAAHRGRLNAALRQTFLVTMSAELIGAVLLTILFLGHGDDLGAAAWRGLFTAVSAFCNAGFALQTDSLMPYAHDAGVLNVVAVLIILGGLSPLAIVAAPHLWRRRPVPLQVKIIFLATAVLLGAGFVGYLALEWNHSLAGMSLLDRLDNAWFQGVTLRTAGFNSVDMSEIRTATLPFMAVFMFIGGAPAGTAGGIKITTAWVLLLAVIGSLRGIAQARIFGRRIPHRTVYEASAIVMIGMAVVMMMLIAIFLTQDMPARLAAFEVVSAVGTVGLSLGATSLLDEVGEVLIMVTMFLGRVGPLTAFVFLAERQMRPRLEYPEEEVEVG